MKLLGLIFFVVVLSVSCQQPERMRVAFFFDPSGSYHVDEYHLSVVINQQLMLDTVVPENSVNKQILLSCFNLEKDNQTLYLKINEKDTVLVLGGHSKCISIFTSYDDHTQITRRAMALEIKMREEGKDFDIQPLFDSIAQNKYSHEYDLLEVIIKRDTCWCD